MKEIKDYIHLYLGCEVKIEKSGYWFVHQLMIHAGDIKVLTESLLAQIEHDRGNVIIKPLLRPLSDMTEEEKDKARMINGGTIPKVKMLDEFLRLIGEEPAFNANCFLYLLSLHFDLFNLIPEGLALDKTKIKGEVEGK